MKYDVLIVGAGPAGIFTALEMLRKGSKKRILIVEKGQPIEKRHANVLFEPQQLLAQSGLGNEKLLGCPGYAFLLADFHKIFQLQKIHVDSPLGWIGSICGSTIIIYVQIMIIK